MELSEIKNSIINIQNEAKKGGNYQPPKGELDRIQSALLDHFRGARTTEERLQVIGFTNQIVSLVREDTQAIAEKVGLKDQVFVDARDTSKGRDGFQGLDDEKDRRFTPSSEAKKPSKRGFNSRSNQNWHRA